MTEALARAKPQIDDPKELDCVVRLAQREAQP